ncbi:hypothetical protein AAEO56_13110 [Flavobacterium sp. DGU11]|uniref:DUF4375 domain-containing protein n=1 Tax=Flavobacterium arundinis TaxID=3139143 RepID=A0ABU9HYG5_9FLAO
MAKNEIITFKDQVYFTPANIIVWMKFYLLSDSAFREAFPEAYDHIAHYYFREYHIGGGGLEGDGFNLDSFLNDENTDRFSAIIADMLSRHSMLRDEINAMVSASEALKPFKEETVQRFFSDNISFDDASDLRTHFELLQQALKQRSLYDPADIGIEELAGEWISTFETEQLRINYNMTDFTPLGTRIRLLITKHDELFHKFTCLAKVYDYVSKEELEIAVRQTYVTLQNGYLLHHYQVNESFELSFKRPVLGYNGNTFKTQFGNVGLTFERI